MSTVGSIPGVWKWDGNSGPTHSVHIAVEAGQYVSSRILALECIEKQPVVGTAPRPGSPHALDFESR